MENIPKGNIIGIQILERNGGSIPPLTKKMKMKPWAVFRRLQVEVEGEGAMKNLMEEGKLLDWMERESVCLLSWVVSCEGCGNG